MEIRRRKKKEKPLNRRQTIFLFEYLAGNSAAKAARLAGYADKDGQARLTANRLLNDPRIKHIIAEEQRKWRKRKRIDLDKLMYDLEHQRRLAIADKNYMAANKATELQGRGIGAWKDKLYTENEIIIQIQDNMKQAQIELLDTLKELAGNTDNVEQIELEEVKTEKRMKIKRRRKRRRFKALLNGNGDKEEINKNKHSNSVHDNILSNNTPHTSDPDWKPLSSFLS